MSRLPLLVAFLSGFAMSAHAGAPAPCDGTENVECENGLITKRCCPTGAKCNFRNVPYVNCGDGYCAEGKDEGRCPSPQPAASAAKDEESCKKDYGGWEQACVARKVTRACIAGVPTNFTGPSRNPSYRTCRLASCTTHRFIEDCYPTREELGKDVCLGVWTKACLGGKIADRCLPLNASIKKNLYQATTYTTCGDGSCVVGEDKNNCPK